jgi:hypothetical protein
MPCSPSQFEHVPFGVFAGAPYIVGNTGYWLRDTDDARFQSSITITGEAGETPEAATLYLFAAYSLLQAMPRSGLEESYRILNEIFEYHSYRPLTLLPPASSPRVKAKLRAPIKQNSFRVEAE